MHPAPIALLAAFVASVVLAVSASANPTEDAALRRAVVGTWLHEQDAGIASVAMFTIYRDDGTAQQLLKTKIVFKSAKGILIENRWRIENGALILSPVRFRSQDPNAQIDLTEATRASLLFAGEKMTYQLKGKSRTEARVARVPADVQAMIDQLSKN